MKKSILFLASSVFVFFICSPVLSQDQDNTKKVSQAIVDRMSKTIDLTPQQKEQLVNIYDQSFKTQAEHRKNLQNQVIGVVGEQNFNKYMKAEKAALATKGKSDVEKKSDKSDTEQQAKPEEKSEDKSNDNKSGDKPKDKGNGK